MSATTWDDALTLWLATLEAAPFTQRQQAWAMLQQRATLNAGLEASARIQWPEAFLHLGPEDYVQVLEVVTA